MIDQIYLFYANVILNKKPYVTTDTNGRKYFFNHVITQKDFDANQYLLGEHYLVNCTFEDGFVASIPGYTLSHCLSPKHYIATPYPRFRINADVQTLSTINNPMPSHGNKTPKYHLILDICKVKKLSTLKYAPGSRHAMAGYPCVAAVVNITDPRGRGGIVTRAIVAIGCTVHSLSYWNRRYIEKPNMEEIHWMEDSQRLFYVYNRHRLYEQAKKFQDKWIGKFRAQCPRMTK